MARSVDRIDITNWQVTGLNVAIPQYTFTLEIWWTDNAGVAQHYGPTTKTYPNDIATMPLAVRKAFAVAMVQATVRVALGIDEWEMYT